jgi:hypothetical protein
MSKTKDVTVPKVSVSEWEKFKKNVKQSGKTIYFVFNELIKQFNQNNK